MTLFGRTLSFLALCEMIPLRLLRSWLCALHHCEALTVRFGRVTGPFSFPRPILVRATMALRQGLVEVLKFS